MPTIQELANEAAGYFETAYRVEGDPDSAYTRTRDDRPEWVSEIVYAAHGAGDMLPDDWRYTAIRSALEAIGEADGDVDDLAHEWADGHVDVYNGARLEWLASHLSRPGYVDEAREEGLIGADTDTLQAVGVGQYMEAREVFASVLEGLRERADEDEDEDEDEDDDDA